MAKLSREELLRIAQLSALELEESEIEKFTQELSGIIAYAEQVNEASTHHEQEAARPVNVFRDDKVVRTNSEAIVLQAPQSEENYFVVPKILE